jgi:hypothetical protein
MILHGFSHVGKILNKFFQKKRYDAQKNSNDAAKK